jgi:hypothetical protein
MVYPKKRKQQQTENENNNKRPFVAVGVYPRTHEALTMIAAKTETYDALIRRLIKHYLECPNAGHETAKSEETLKEEAARKIESPEFAYRFGKKIV